MNAMSQHQCMIYAGSPNKHLPRLVGLIVANLSKNHRSLYLNSPPMIAGLRSYLAAAGVDVEREVTRGALILSSARDHLANGAFDVAGMIAVLQQTAVEAKRDGYEGLWISGDMTWELGTNKDFLKL